MTQTATTPCAPAGHHTVTPYVIVSDARAAIDFWSRAFGAVQTSLSVDDAGKVRHAEVRIGDSPIMLNDEMGGAKSAKAIGSSPASLWVYVEDCDALFNRAVAAGARVAPGPMGQLTDQFWGDRTGTFTDPHGYQWTIATHKEDLTPEEIQQRQDAFMKQFAAQPAHG